MIDERPSSQRRLAPASRAVAALTAVAVTLASVPVRAQDGSLPVIRDAETEQLLSDYTAPILRAAGLSHQNIHPVIINDRAFNAFVMDAKHIFVNAGALVDSKTPNQIIGVLAHETGHIAGGHLMKLRTELANAQTAAILAMLLGVGAAVAGARGGAGAGDAAMAAVMAPQSAMMFSLLSYQRQQEEQADKAGVKFLTATGQSAKGMYETFKRFADDELYRSQGMSPYMRSHPMSKERVAALTEIAKLQPLLGQKGSTGIAAAPRFDARQAAGLPGTSRHRGPPLSRVRPVTPGAVCACDRCVSLWQSSRCPGTDRRLDRGDARQPVFLRAQGSGPARERASGRGNRAAASRDFDRAKPHAHAGHAGAGAGRDQQSGGRRRSDQQPAKRDHCTTRISRTPTASWRWRTDARATTRRRILPPRRRRSPKATSAPRASLPNAPRPGSRWARRAGSKPTISKPTNRRVPAAL